MSQENVEIVRRVFDAFNEQDAEAVVTFWATAAEWRPAFIGGGLMEGAVYRGHAGVREFIAMQNETWETVVADPVTIRDLGEQALVEVHLSAVGRTSGIPVDRVTWNVFAIRDGKIAAGRVFTTKAEALEAVGLRE
jgi:ketosteroid isomerase-like protein